LEGGTPPERILLLPYARRAAREMLGRAARMTPAGRDARGRVWGGTFHAVANRLLRAFGQPVGIRPDFTVLDQADAADLMNLIRGELRLGQGDRRFPKKDTLASIYSFRAATVRNILDFPTAFPGARLIPLEQNYRSTPGILDASNAVIALARERHAKTLWSVRAAGVRPELLTHLDEADQSDAVCRSVLDARERGTPLRRQAVLFRAAHHSDLLEVA